MAPPEAVIGPSYLPLSRESGARFAAAKPAEIVTVLPGFLTPEGLVQLREEARRLMEHGSRRDFELGGTPRHMRTVSQQTLIAIGRLIPGLLFSPKLHEFLRGMAGTDLQLYADADEACVLLHLEGPGDTHGGHTDEFEYAFNIAVETPGEGESGGMLEYDGSGNPNDLALPGRTQVPLRPGDAYLMRRSDLVPHRVTPLTLPASQRTIASLSLSRPAEIHRRSVSSAMLFGQ